MLTDIRSRLIISYSLVIGVALIIAFMTLLLVLIPLQARLAQVRLAAELSKARGPLLQRLSQDISQERLVEVLNNQRPNPPDRLLIINHRQNIVFDSGDGWVGESVPLDVTSRRNLSGTLIGPGGERLVYVAAPLARPGANERARLWIAIASPRLGAPRAVLSDLGGGFLVAGFIAFFISLLLSFLIARSIANPLRAIARAAEAVAERDYSRQVPETGPDEVKQVAYSFNSMVRQVQASQIASRDFVSNVSHELKTPLTSIQGFSQALLEGATQDEASRKRAAAIIYDEADRLRRLVEDLLDLARIDSGQIIIGSQPVNLTNLLDGTLNNLSAQVSAKNLILNRHYQGVPDVVGDGDRLTQVFTNLLDNAIKHTPAGGKITISGTVSDGPDSNQTSSKATDKQYARIAIADTGPGIRPEELERIFERFYQVDKSRKRGQGAGLGLAIAHDIVKAHRGHIQAESIFGQGTMFTVWLPIRKADVTTQVSKRR